MHMTFHLRDEIDKLYTSKKEGGNGIASIVDWIDAIIQLLKEYTKKND